MEQYNKNLQTKPGETKDKKDNSGFDSGAKGRVWAGLVVITIGSILLARAAGVDIPRWIISWPMILIAVGVFVGARSNFRHWYWLIPVFIGVAFLIDRIYWDINIKPFIWPIAIVVIGLVMIFRSRKRESGMWDDWHKANVESNNAAAASGDDIVDMVAVFGSNRKTILSKNFRGGETVALFGGTELNLTQADITGPVMLEMTQVFGGSKLIVPANWTIKSSELVSVFGGVDDKRMIPGNPDPTKVLVLRGTNVFGGLEIKSY